MCPIAGGNDDLEAQRRQGCVDHIYFPHLAAYPLRGGANSTQALRQNASAADISQNTTACIAGFDLMDTLIPDDRIAVSYNYASQGGKMIALSNGEFGLYQDRRNKLLYLHYDNCTNNLGSGKCTGPLKEEDRLYWLDFLQHKTNLTILQEFVASAKITQLKAALQN
jgi:hypothetical protein